MSRIKPVIAVYEHHPGLLQGLKKEYPNADIRRANLGEDVKSKDPWRSLLRTITPDEKAVLQEADILVVSVWIFCQVMYDLPRTKWVQLLSTGVDYLFKNLDKDKPLPKYTLTRNISKEIGKIMAEYVVGQIISHERRWIECRENQVQRCYSRDQKFSFYRSLNQLTVGILGMGPMGLETAGALKYFGCTIYGYTRRPKEPSERAPQVDEYWHSEQMDSFLRDCDYIVSVLPSTPSTRGLLGGDVLKDAKKSPVFINIGRGDLISEKDLLRALNAGWLSCAILDVFEKEPVPEESDLWTHPKVVMTPHVSGFGNAVVRTEAVMDCFRQNYDRYLEGKDLLGSVDLKAGY